MYSSDRMHGGDRIIMHGDTMNILVMHTYCPQGSRTIASYRRTFVVPFHLIEVELLRSVSFYHLASAIWAQQDTVTPTIDIQSSLDIVILIDLDRSRLGYRDNATNFSLFWAGKGLGQLTPRLDSELPAWLRPWKAAGGPHRHISKLRNLANTAGLPVVHPVHYIILDRHSSYAYRSRNVYFTIRIDLMTENELSSYRQTIELNYYTYKLRRQKNRALPLLGMKLSMLTPQAQHKQKHKMQNFSITLLLTLLAAPNCCGIEIVRKFTNEPSVHARAMLITAARYEFLIRSTRHRSMNKFLSYYGRNTRIGSLQLTDASVCRVVILGIVLTWEDAKEMGSRKIDDALNYRMTPFIHSFIRSYLDAAPLRAGDALLSSTSLQGGKLTFASDDVRRYHESRLYFRPKTTLTLFEIAVRRSASLSLVDALWIILSQSRSSQQNQTMYFTGLGRLICSVKAHRNGQTSPSEDPARALSPLRPPAEGIRGSVGAVLAKQAPTERLKGVEGDQKSPDNNTVKPDTRDIDQPTSQKEMDVTLHRSTLSSPHRPIDPTSFHPPPSTVTSISI
ncbi:uncharacterized protein MYCFIDRAFT_171247 [Pseudocercospora fijiensis CIRAD86]|uniref:Uncharacterized protein n=1 Tax=Pseudocercospora fijiensis (strain CIRAD86) TaxID=383855 RepID=M3B7L9_PSEFD|nr:uncharacterized protein MYCFIDRAFT_171247 [Pseudocercospora fijiensis CIRAD86]EME85313.1 hypothetical protein MYCFIDRAFT_171247 [Pseudocercospora fijiensis CIRAD86]